METSQKKKWENDNLSAKAICVLAILHCIFIVLFGFLVEYDEETGPTSNSTLATNNAKSQLEHLYPMYQDVQVMMLVGFGFLMTFLKRHGYNSTAFTFLLTCFIIEWSILVNGLFGLIVTQQPKIAINLESFLHADFAAATVLISFGAVLGVASPTQLLLMAFLEVLFYNLNILIGVKYLGAIDVGGSIFIHAFGAYFGLAVSRMLYQKKLKESNEYEGSDRNSDLFAMIGTLFLWLYWPSFNAGPAYGNERHRAVIHTVLSLSACTVTTFIASAIVNKGKLKMVDIQNATLAGGVAMGACADMLIGPFAALIIGSVAGLISTLGFNRLQDILLEYKFHDTCGIHNLHGMPGVLGGIASAIAAGVASREIYHESYTILFEPEVSKRPDGISPGAAQALALLIALGVACVSGVITGAILTFPCLDPVKSEDYFVDEKFWAGENENKDSISKEGVSKKEKSRVSETDEEEPLQLETAA